MLSEAGDSMGPRPRIPQGAEGEPALGSSTKCSKPSRGSVIYLGLAVLSCEREDEWKLPLRVVVGAGGSGPRKTRISRWDSDVAIAVCLSSEACVWAFSLLDIFRSTV